MKMNNIGLGLGFMIIIYRYMTGYMTNYFKFFKVSTFLTFGFLFVVFTFASTKVKDTIAIIIGKIDVI
jgi:hypothetical protein